MTRKVTLWKDDRYQGNRLTLGEGRYDADILSKFLFHDKLSSLQVPSGMQVTLFWDAGWKGRTRVITGDTPSVGPEWNDKTSSLVVRDNGSTGPKITVWQHVNFNGSCEYFGVGRHEVQDIGVLNDQFSSLEVPSGMLLTLYEHAGFQGRIEGHYQTTASLPNFNDITSSLIVDTEQNYARFLQQGTCHNGQIGSPPTMTGYELTADTSEPKLIGEVLLPYVAVKDPEYPPPVQAERSRYYILRREQLWYRDDVQEHQVGSKETRVIRHKQGASTEVTKSIKDTLSWELDADGNFKLFGIGVDLKGKITHSTETSESTKGTTMQETELTNSIEFAANVPRVIVVSWVMIDRYTVCRYTGERVAQWDIRKPGWLSDAYPQLDPSKVQIIK